MPITFHDPNRLLVGMRRALDSVVAPDVQSTEGRETLRMINEILGYLISQNSGVAERTSLDVSLEVQARLSEVQECLTDGVPRSDSDVWRDGFSQASGPGGAGVHTAAIATIEANETYYSRRAHAIADATRQTAVAATDAPLEQTSLETFLSERLGQPIIITSMNRLLGGFSKETYICDLKQGSEIDGMKSVVVRRDIASSPTRTSVVNEYPLVEHLAAFGIPVPKVVALSAASTPDDVSYGVFERLEGVPVLPGDWTATAWGADPEVRQALGRELATTMARLHAVDVASLPGVTIDEAIDPTEALRQDLLSWRRKFMCTEIGADSGMDVAFGWLLANVPEVSARSLVHGDFAAYNMLASGSRLTALLDWELAHIGDSAEDLAYARRHVEPLIAWEDFVATYVAAGGHPYVEESGDFYEVWSNVRNVVFIARLRQSFLNGTTTQLKYAYSPIFYYQFYLLDALRIVKTSLISKRVGR